MKVLVDTNVLLDVLYKRTEFIEASKRIWNLCESRKITGWISALTVPNIIYVLRKELTPEKTDDLISRILTSFEISSLSANDLKKAARMYFPDYEDAIQMTVARKIKADYIITRNIRDFTESKVPAVLPSELLEILYE